jgi:hypothetical protein
MRHTLRSEKENMAYMMASRFGREESGIGGGPLGSPALRPTGRLEGIGGGVSADLFKPNSSADRFGNGGTRRRDCEACVSSSLLPGLREDCLEDIAGLEGN